MLDSLMDIEIAYSLLKGTEGSSRDPIDVHYESLKTDFEVSSLEETITLKMADCRRSEFYVVFTTSLCTLGLKQLLRSLLFQIIRL